MVMQAAFRKRVDRDHPELGQPVGAPIHVRTVCVKASLTWLGCGGRFGWRAVAAVVVFGGRWFSGVRFVDARGS